MTLEYAGLERELQRFPTTITDEFQRAAEAVRLEVHADDLMAWAQQGVDIARQTIRSWEAASEYYRVSPEVLQQLTPAQLLSWAKCGSDLCQESPTLGVAFFRASPACMRQLRPRHIQGWADLGRSLYRGTWKSGALTTKFFEISPFLLESMSYQELEGFAKLVGVISHKSSEMAADCLVLGQQVLSHIGDNRLALINLSYVVVESNWREVKGCFESMSRLVVHLEEEQRGRLLGLASTMVRDGLTNVSLFLNETSSSLSKTESAGQGLLLDMAETLLPISREAVAAFLRNGPDLLEKVSQQQLKTWFERGRDILIGNLDGGLAYFKVESSTSEAMIQNLSSAIELERVREVLRMYCRALAGADIGIAPLGELMSRNIGWVSEDHAATEGTVVYLPPVVDRYGIKLDNFSLLKVVATHQVAHIEFGSFEFSFERPSTRFRDLRKRRERHRHKKDGGKPQAQQGLLLEAGEAGVERELLTDMGRFFNLFADRKLALDVFTVVEDGRLDHRIMAEYPGIAGAYRRIQSDALAERPQIEQLPLQQAMVEFLVRLSLQGDKSLPVPTVYIRQAKAIGQLARRVLSVQATVEDSAEATLRICDVIGSMPNVELPKEAWEKTDLDQDELSEEQMEQLFDQAQRESESRQDSQADEEQEYESPPQIDYRGDFKPELTQLLANLRMQSGGNDDQQGEQELTKEMLEQLLANSAELDIGAGDGQYDKELSAFVQNFLKGASTSPPPDAGKGYGFIPHVDDDGSSLETSEPRAYVYDEWDFRAVDYKPRWCVVREKWMPEGDSQFFIETLRSNATLMNQIRRQFEMIMPEVYRKTKHLPDGEDFDLDAVIESIIDRWAGESPSEKVHWRRNRMERDVAVAFLLDMSASTAEAIDESRRLSDGWDAPDDPAEYMAWLRTRRGETQPRSYKRIIDVEKESIVLLINAMETIGDSYGIYGFSGYGRENVEFYIVKDLTETFTDRVKRRIDKISPLHATRMGPAIRHAVSKLAMQNARTKLLFLISDGRPQDRGYSREGVEKEYAVHDTKMALTEARRQNITPFALTVDKAGHDYLKTMCQDMGYEVLTDITALPVRLPMLYRKLTI